jgi:hypothetical protein
MLPSDAATRLKIGACEDDAPPEFYDPRCRAQTLGGSTSGLTQDRTALPSRRVAPIKPAVCTTETVMLPSDAATRLRNGSCEDDEPSQDTKRAAARKPLEGQPPA